MPLSKEDAYSAVVGSTYMNVNICLLECGLEVFMVIHAFSVYRDLPLEIRRTKRPFMVVLCFFVLTLMAFTISDSVSFGRALTSLSLTSSTLSASFGALTSGPEVTAELVFARLEAVLAFISIMLGEGIMLYRCHVLHGNRLWVMILPTLIYLTLLVMASLMLAFSFVDQSKGPTPILKVAYIGVVATPAAAALMSVTTTTLILVPIWRMRRRIRKLAAAGAPHLKQYTTTSFVLIESAFPLAIAGLVSFCFFIDATVVMSEDQTGILLKLSLYTYSIWLSLLMFSPVFIIYRVIVGKSWATHHETTRVLDLVSQPIRFQTGLTTSSHGRSYCGVDSDSLEDETAGGNQVSNMDQEKPRTLPSESV